MITTVTPKGQVVIPKPIRDALHIEPFDKVYFEVRPRERRVIVEPVESIKRMMGFIKTKKRVTEKQIQEAIEAGFAENL